MPAAPTPPTNSWEPESASGSDPTITTNRPEAQPPEPPQPANGPRIAADGTGRWLSPPEAMAQAAAEEQQAALAREGYPLWQQTTAQKGSPSS
jgi:hypothetical protein